MRCKGKSITLINPEFLINSNARHRAVLNGHEWGSNNKWYFIITIFLLWRRAQKQKHKEICL